MKHGRQSLRGIIYGLAVGLTIVIFTGNAHADPYGRGNYSKCTYVTCTPTQVVLPSGLKVSINLADGQLIPRSGYTVTITPLNGSGKSFKQATLSLDGTVVATVMPDATGTAEWIWDPVRYPGTTVTIDVTDTDGTVTTHTFHVRIGDAPATGPVSSQPTKPAIRSGGIAALLDFAGASLDKLSQTAAHTIRSLPKPLAYSFPYIIIAFLGLNTLLLLFQMQREVQEYHILRSLLAREKVIAESKKTLMELISHYLRTPITIILGGIDMLPADTAQGKTAITLRHIAQGIGTKIEGLIADTRTAAEVALSQRGETALSATALWRQPGLFIPALAIIIILIPYNYLAQHGGTLTISQVNLALQTVALLAVITGTYLVMRHMHLRRRDRTEMQRLLDAQAASNSIRDELVHDTATTLRADLATVDQLAGTLPITPATKFITEGQQRFHSVLHKCTVAATLRGGHSPDQPVSTTLDTLVTAAQKTLQSKITGYQVRLSGQEVAIATPNPTLITYVIQTVLDNALTYSKAGSAIYITAQTTDDGTNITITDKGEGMPPAKVSQLFQPFFKSEGAEKFNHEGMGFSLYLDKLIMQYLGGDISLVSQKGHGTTVTLYLGNAN